MLKKKMEIPKIRKEDVDFYIERARTLALPYEEQYKMLYALDDYMTNDIASDWIWDDLGIGVMHMFNNNLINNNAIELYKEIDRSFWDISIDGSLYDEDLWTLNGLKNHPFWETQRRRAHELLNILEKIKC